MFEALVDKQRLQLSADEWGRLEEAVAKRR